MKELIFSSENEALQHLSDVTGKKIIVSGSLKIKPEDRKKLELYLDNYVNKVGREKLAEYKERLKSDSKVKDIEERFRWDLLYNSGIRIGDGKGMSGDIELYSYMNDNHIDSVLKDYVRKNNL